jgi:hypothetical protein
MSAPASRYADLSRDELARLVPELLLIGHLIDRAGMPHCVAAFGRDGMTRIAIEEWAAASPIYTRRMQEALGYAPPRPGEGDVVTIFKGLHFDIGSPPQFMDFRFTVHDSRHGEFQLAHCGALMDVEPMGEDFVEAMCHDIEDPTFDATAVATNPRAQMRPIHRPPRIPADRQPHCAWTVTIDDSHPLVEGIPALATNEQSRAAMLELAPIDLGDEGLADYAGPLLSDPDYRAFSHSALCRVADEVCLEMHLLDRAFVLALRGIGADDGTLLGIWRKQLVGIAGVAAERLVEVLGLSRTRADMIPSAVRLLALHPMFNPSAYVGVSAEGSDIVVEPSPAHDDGAWVCLCGPDWAAPLQAIVRAVDPHLDVEVAPEGRQGAWRATVLLRSAPAREADEVVLAKFSTGAAFRFSPRRSEPVAWTSAPS